MASGRLLSMLTDDVEGYRVGHGSADQAQQYSTKREGVGIRHDLFIDGAKAEIAPIKGRTVGLSKDWGVGPIGASKDRHDGPWIVDEGTGEQRDEIQSECPCAEAYQNHINALEGTEGDRGSDGKCESCSLGRFFEMENVLEQRLKGCHGCGGLHQCVERKCSYLI